MSIKNLKDTEDIFSDFSILLDQLHKEGPVKPEILEKIAYYKIFHPEFFLENEEKIISMLGLFYKIKTPSNIYTFLISGFGEQNNRNYGEYLTPIQASIRNAVDNNKIISISAPTSSGKSFSIRDFIASQKGDAVVVVPSRALIAEYVDVMRRKFQGNKTVMISSFIDTVFTSRKLRRIFVLTPERARELFKSEVELKIDVFFFDEAQVSEEKERGIIFDVLVRRIQKKFPNSKIIFAHPYVDNPEAQLKKHGFAEKLSYSRSYTYGSVGKICVYKHQNQKNYYFSPYTNNGHHIKNCIEFPNNFEEFALNGENSVLIYVSKRSIYNGSFLNDFNTYIDKFHNLESTGAIEIIDTISELLGADQVEHSSKLVNLLRKGVVIHHGSIPLDVRFLIEDFIRNGFCRICFATSTLAQGINMPFDIVWLNNMRFLGENETSRALAFKNLIGRSGRLSKAQKYDFGYVFTKNPNLFSSFINEKFRLKENSVIEEPVDEFNKDSQELLESIRSETFDDEKQLPKTTIERLSSMGILECSKKLIDIIYGKENNIKENIGGSFNKSLRQEINRLFRNIFETAINRELYDGESGIFDEAIRNFLHKIQGRSFKEIVAIRYSHISRRDENHNGYARFSQPADKLPNSNLKNYFSIYDNNTLAKDVSYDTIIFDTYDYLDQVISYSLSNYFTAAFIIYKEKTNDPRAEKIIELFKYGTNNVNLILLFRYGFPPENISEINQYIETISDANIIFKDTIKDASEHIKKITEWYRD